MIISAKNKVKKEDFWIEKLPNSIIVCGKTRFIIKYGYHNSAVTVSYYMYGRYQWVLVKSNWTIHIYDFYDINLSKILKTIKL